MTTTDDGFDGDPHPAWAKKVASLIQIFEIRDLDLEDEDLDRLGVQKDGLMDRIATTPARTLVGVREQVRMVLVNHERGLNDLMEVDALALENALATLDKMLAIERRREKRQRQKPLVRLEKRP